MDATIVSAMAAVLGSLVGGVRDCHDRVGHPEYDGEARADRRGDPLS